LKYYCDDVISMPNFHPMVRGKSDLKRMTRMIFASGMKFESLESTTLEVKVDGIFVYEIGTFKQAAVMPGAGEAVEQSGKYLTVWRKQPGGSLQIAVEMYNSDAAR
jgi:ketosteroid isomerase-like protein